MSASSEGSAKTGSQALGRLVKLRRKELGMSRQDLADATGVPYSTVAQIETAYRGVSPGRLGVLARALSLDPKDLFDVLAGESPPTGATRTGMPATSGRPAPQGWYGNPGYAVSAVASPLPAARAQPESVAPGPPPPAGETAQVSSDAAVSDDIVAAVLGLLSQLPPRERIPAMAEVQMRLLTDLVDEEVARGRRRRADD